MSYNLFLDDNRDPNRFLHDLRTWVVVRSYNEFVETITEFGLPNFVSVDHDLADEHYVCPNSSGSYKEKTGYDCAVWLTKYCADNFLPLPEWQVHSMNPVGKQNITTVLEIFERMKSE